MDRAQIDRWNGRYWQAPASVCVAEATFITSPATAAQNEPEEVVVTGSRIRQNPVEAVADSLQRRPISGSAINRSNDSSGNLGFPPEAKVYSDLQVSYPVPGRFFHARAVLEF